MAELLIQLYNVITYALSIYSILLVIYILMSWVPASRETKFGRILEKIAEPYLGFFRKFIPPLGMIDISPIIALLALRFIGQGLAPVFNFFLRLL
ncbi:YggT family protein [Sporosarcina gallistercoris]|uniref:YggT family protein n=1 Tax=Sporosarcina gallistercoris TaxID=2762245 RepID=A0ABR8PGA5_9BACL|nr:YggT family protein [Sporosarcina gallistercoris]MBD7907200.1 YggT family protein [Sporosarcina gallistercoris]